MASMKRRVHCQYEDGFVADALEAWLNTLPGRLVSVYWSGGAGTVAVTEEQEYDHMDGGPS